jgi:hypothetical protein
MDLIGYLLSWLSYRVVAVCLASVPLTHAYGLFLRQPPSWGAQHLLLFPLTGGNRHIIFQLLAWVRLCPQKRLFIIATSLSILRYRAGNMGDVSFSSAACSVARDRATSGAPFSCRRDIWRSRGLQFHRRVVHAQSTPGLRFPRIQEQGFQELGTLPRTRAALFTPQPAGCPAQAS